MKIDLDITIIFQLWPPASKPGGNLEDEDHELYLKKTGKCWRGGEVNERLKGLSVLRRDVARPSRSILMVSDGTHGSLPLEGGIGCLIAS